MATNVYRSSHSIQFADQPTTLYGWHISTSGDAKSVEQFRSQEAREAFVRTIASRFPELPQHEVEELAAFITFYECGESEWVEFAVDFKLSDFVDQFDDWHALLNPDELPQTATETPQTRRTETSAVGSIANAIERFSETELAWDEDEFENDALADEQDAIFRHVFATIRDNLPELNQVCETLDRVASVVECTFANDPDTGERTDDEPDHSAADVFEMVCNLDDSVRAARETMSQMFRMHATTDNNATA